MTAITAITAIVLFRVVKISFTVNNNMTARCIAERINWTTISIPFSISSVDSVSSVFPVIEEFSGGGGRAKERIAEGFIEGLFESFRPDRGLVVSVNIALARDGK